MTNSARLGSCLAALTLAWASSARAQLADTTQISPTVPGSAIEKSLDEQIGAGQGDEFTPGSSVYLIKRDPARSIRRGRQLFQRKFTEEQGLGPRVSPHATGDILETRALGAGLSDSCAGCHGRPRGAAGFGGDVATRPDSRDAPHLFGLGLQEMLADEMTRELRGIRDEALAEAATGRVRARRPGRPCRGGRGCRSEVDDVPEIAGAVVRRLTAKGVDFGWIAAFADGTLDRSGVEGVDPDLRVRPFFHHGETISIREFAVGAFKAEMGLEAFDPVLCAATDPGLPTSAISPAGFVFDPDADTFERPPVCDEAADGDEDGITAEIDPALVDHLEFYLLNYFKPGRGGQNRRTAAGLRTFNAVGCADCHVQNLEIEVDRRIADVETVHDPERGIFNRLFATAVPLFELVHDGEPYAQLLPLREPFLVENIFSDLKRHDLGEAFHERDYDGSLRTHFLTEALWGVGSTAPYGHDGRSIDLPEVILRHGGEAQASRDAFARLGSRRQRQVVEYLQTLVLFPPDDTASTLNPGNRGGHPQLPENHGSINLGALFQIDEEGGE